VAPEVLAKYCPFGHLGRDKYNNYLLLIRFGLIDVKGLLLSEKPRVCLTFFCETIEKVYFLAKNSPNKYKRSPTAISQSTVIMDMDGFSMRHITYKPGMVSHNPTCLYTASNKTMILRKNLKVDVKLWKR